MAATSFTRAIKAATTAATALATVATAVAQSAPQPIGIASSVVKEAKLSNAQTPKPRPVVVRQRVALADLIQTGKQSQLQLLLLDHSTFSIGANARLRIDRYVYDPSRGRSMGSSVARGAFRFMSGRSSPANRATIDTPVATIGIRGTILEGVVGEVAAQIARRESDAARRAEIDKAGATLVVLRGPGANTQGTALPGAASVTAGGATVELTGPMQAAFVPRAGAMPIGPFSLSPAGLAQLQNLVLPQLAPADGGGLLGGLLVVLPVAAAIGAGVLGGGGGAGNDRDRGDPGQGNSGGGVRSTSQPASPNNPDGLKR